MNIIIALNTSWNLINFRAGLIRSLVTAGYDVIAVAPFDEYSEHLEKLGCRYIPFPMDNKGTNPWRDACLFYRFWRLLKKERPSVFLGYTIKPNIYGSMAAHCLGIPVVNNISGLGATFIKKGWLNWVVQHLYRLSLSRSFKVFFQNHDDKQFFIEQSIVASKITDCLPGSGIDLHYFSPIIKSTQEKFSFLLVARMLWDKGIGEYIEAARLIKKKHEQVTFCLLGFLDVANPTAVSRAQMNAWVEEGVVDYLGTTDDVRLYLSEADCVVLPSYREGLSRSLLEAAAMAKPIVTTNTPGCRDVVTHGVNGLLCEPRDSKDLADKLEQMILLTEDARLEMGRQGRIKVAQEFDEKMVIHHYLKVIETLQSTVKGVTQHENIIGQQP